MGVSVSRIYRLIELIAMLQSGRDFTTAELAGELQTSRRTIFRDLNVLEMARIPYYFDKERQSYAIRDHFFLPPINLTLEEAMSLLVIGGGFRRQGQVPLMAHGAKAALKLENALPAAIRRHVGSMMSRMNVRLAPLASHKGHDSIFEQMSAAIVQHQACRIKYMSFADGREIVTLIHPMRLVFIGRAWYVIAYSRKDRALRTYKLIRIRNLHVTDKTFKPRRKLNLDDYFGQAWCMIPEGKIYKIHLHFEPKVGGNVAEVLWHPTQKIRKNADGSVEYYASVDGIGEISWWILGYGDQVKVVSPKALADRVAAIAGAMVEKYRGIGKGQK
ncbi:MAG: YafY family transcriptional regulator [Planctomycetes bacterium]|nr:YafY family transcriptional regulator [Planctomycetota bacterium]